MTVGAVVELCDGPVRPHSGQWQHLTKRGGAGVRKHANTPARDRPAESVRVELGPTCLSVPGCTRTRLRFHGYCDQHGPPTAPLPPTRCQSPIRCYCDECNPELTPASCELPPPHLALAGRLSHPQQLPLRLVQGVGA